jgi:hypothetical protein
MEESTLESGRTQTCTVGASILGKTVEFMKESILMTKSMARDATRGQMAESTWAVGSTVSRKVRGNTFYKTAKNAREFGKMEKGLSGKIESVSRVHLV